MTRLVRSITKSIATRCLTFFSSDLKVVEENVRTIELDGLVWGPSKLVEIAFGTQFCLWIALFADSRLIH